MLEQPVLQLLRDCRAHLRRQLPFRATRALIQRIDGLLIAQREAARFGNTIVAQARSTAQLLNGVSIDEDESGVRSHPDGVQVRAWLLVPVEMIATIERADPALEIAFL